MITNWHWGETQKKLIDIVTNKIQEDNETIRVFAHGGIGCHAIDTPILMFDGTIKMVQDVKVGDLLMGDDSTARTVLNLHSGIDDMYEVKSRDNSYIVNSGHILCLKYHGCTSKLYKKKTEYLEIKVSDWLKLSSKKKKQFKGYKAPIVFKSQPITIDPYYLGLWLGDGNSRNTGITNIDPEIIDYVKKYARELKMDIRESEDDIFITNHGDKNSNPLTKMLRDLELIKNKHIPENYKINSKEIRLQLLAGLIDTDGSYDGKGFDFINKNKNISDGVAFIANSLGFRANVKECRKKCCNNGVWGTYYRVGIYGNIDQIPTLIKRKQAKHRETLTMGNHRKIDSLVSAIRISWHSKDKYYGFETDGNHKYCLGDFTVTHNSGKSVCIAFLVDFICRNTPGINFLCARRSFESIRLDTMEILKRNPGILDSGKGKWTDKGKTFAYYNGSILHFEHLEKSDSLLGPTYGGCWIEQVELCAQDDYRLLRGRIRQYSENNQYNSNYAEAIKNHKCLPARNYLFLTANPKANWVQTEIIKNKNTDFELVSMPTYGNKANLPKDYINENESDAFKRRFYEGKWESLAGLCYPEFNENNIIDAENAIELRYKKDGLTDFSKLSSYIIVDPGYVTSKFAVMFAVMLPDNRLYIFDEISRNGKDVEESDKVLIPEMADLIQEKINHYNIKNYFGIIDFAANAKSEGGASKAQQFRDHGIILTNSIKRIKGTTEIDSIFKINSMFKQKKIIINMRCPATLRELDLFSWKTDKNGVPTKEEPADHDNDFCLIGETKIEIENGYKQIKDIKIGDIVKTSNGYQKVYDSMMTNSNAKVHKLILSNGQSLIGTDNHPVYSNGSKIMLSSLSYFDIIDVSQTKENTSWLNIQITKVINIKDILKANISIFKDWINYFTEKFGKNIMDQSQKDMKSTTLISIPQTIQSPILNVLQEKSIEKNTGEDVQIKSENILNPLMNQQKHGIQVRKVWNGIVSMLKKVLIILFPRISYAIYVEKNINQKNMIQSSALINVDQKQEDNQELIMKQENVSFAGKILLLINILKQKHAPSYVVDVQEVGHAEVYNLSVENAHQYYANGILVGNCDCLRYLINSGPLTNEILPEKPYNTVISEKEYKDKYNYMEGLFKSEIKDEKQSITAHKRTKLDFGIY